MNFIDRATIADASIRKTADGYTVAEVPVSRTGIQDYAGYEMGKPDMARVRVYRPATEVFADASLASMAHKPVTNDHPADAVTADNWREHSRGWTGETIRKDEASGRVFVPMLFADAGAIAQLDAGKREVSCGYSCDIDWTAGVTDAGESYDAIQRAIRINHIALVSKGRAGSTCRVGDSWQPIEDHKEPIVATKTITFDGLPVEVTDAAEAVINKLTAANEAVNAKLTDAEKRAGEGAALVATRDGEIAALNAKLTDAEMTPAKLAALVSDRAKLIEGAKRIAPDLDYAADDNASIKRKAVTAKLGDATPADDAGVNGAFAVLAASVSDSDPLRDVLRDAKPTKDANAVRLSARDDYLASLTGTAKDAK